MRAVFQQPVPELHNILVFDTVTGALETKVAGAPSTVGSQGKSFSYIADGYLLGFVDAENEPIGRRYLADLYASALGDTPGTPAVYSPPSAGTNFIIHGKNSVEGAAVFWLDNEAGTNKRIGLAKIVSGAPTLQVGSIGDYPFLAENPFTVVLFSDGSARVVGYPGTGTQMLISTPVGAGPLNVAQTVTMHLEEATDFDAATVLGLINTGRIADTLSVFGDFSYLQTFAMYVEDGVLSSVQLDYNWITPLYDLTCAAAIATGFSEPIFYDQQLQFNPSLTGFSITSSTETPGPTTSLFYDYAVPTFTPVAGAFWTRFLRAQEQP